MSKVVISIVGLIFLLILAGNVLPDVVNDVAAEDYAENFENTTGAGVTSANETLSYAHYYEDLTDLSADSDNVADTPVVLAYDEDDYRVTVGGLAESDSRILTIDYAREAHQEFTGFTSFMRLTPFIFILGGIAGCIWGLFSAWKSRG
jgi:hypothetical protein